MTPSPAYRAIADLERLSAAALLAVRAELASLELGRQRLVARNAQARRTLLGSACWGSFQCHALVAHTLVVATAASDLSAAHRRGVARLAALVAERSHWARCRRGLERRARRPAQKPLERSWRG